MEEEYKNCFACGSDNPIGLKLKFDYHDNEATCFFTLNKLFEGYPDVIHGGLIATILDEAMAKIILNENIVAVTVDMNLKYKKTVHPDMQYKVVSRITEVRRKKILTEAEIYTEDKTLCAKASAVFFKLK